ncbi:hypothetical protein DW091_19490 [Eubacterium sp. AM05-23]|nr:hypothetical protein DW091_19490 [Eubacterium sp. AM05-23]
MKKRKFSKLTAIFLSFCLVMACISPVFAEENTPKREVSLNMQGENNEQKIEQGKEFTLTLNCAEPFGVMNAQVVYDSSKVECISCETPIKTGSNMVNDNKNISAVMVNISQLDSDIVAPDTIIMSMVFKAKEDITGNASFEAKVTAMYLLDGNLDGTKVTPTVTNNVGEIMITAPPTDISELTSKIAEAETIDGSLYTAASYQNLEAAIAAAKEITTENTKEEVAAQVKALDDAMKQLVKAVDKTALKAVVAEAKNYDEALYTPDSYAALTEAVASAQSVLDADLADNTENQKTVADAAQAVKDAIAGLSAKGDQEALAASIQAAEAALAREDVTYMADTKTSVENALSAARALVGKENATDAEVSAAVKNLNDAVAKLVIAADKDTFNAAVAQVRESFKEETYTSSSWKAVAEALSNADAMADRLAKGQVPAAEAEKVLTDLQNATKGLVPKAAKTEDLTKAIEAAKKLDESHYTADSYAVVKEALSAAEKVAGNLNDSTQEQVDTAAANLNAAASKLVTVATDEKTGVVVNGLQPGEGIKVDDKSKDKEAVAGVDEAIKNASEFANAKETEILFLADITPEVTENADGSFTVTIPLKAAQLKYDAYYVGHKGADGSFTWQAVTPDADGKITFTTKSFSEFTVVGMNRQDESPSTDGNQASNAGTTGSDSNKNNASGGTINPVTGLPYTEDEISNGALQAVAMLALIGLCGVVFYRRQRKTEH